MSKLRFIARSASVSGRRWISKAMLSPIWRTGWATNPAAKSLTTSLIGRGSARSSVSSVSTIGRLPAGVATMTSSTEKPMPALNAPESAEKSSFGQRSTWWIDRP